ncbi:tRNA-guanine transglycosylase [Candidatus Parcubacteria bacterium]|jgi:queuine tRNA-ribosyltransferase|nr:tRNA-guanine transglycosylase [Candidatus Parcubacteria bacterium]
MFDCVIPTREARHGKLYIRKKAGFGKDFYENIIITNAKFKNDKRPINNNSLKNYSRAYLHHLFKTQEPLALRLATTNNIEFYLQLMADIRSAVKGGKL